MPTATCFRPDPPPAASQTGMRPWLFLLILTGCATPAPVSPELQKIQDWDVLYSGLKSILLEKKG